MHTPGRAPQLVKESICSSSNPAWVHVQTHPSSAPLTHSQPSTHRVPRESSIFPPFSPNSANCTPIPQLHCSGSNLAQRVQPSRVHAVLTSTPPSPSLPVLLHSGLPPCWSHPLLPASPPQPENQSRTRPSASPSPRGSFSEFKSDPVIPRASFLTLQWLLHRLRIKPHSKEVYLSSNVVKKNTGLKW